MKKLGTWLNVLHPNPISSVLLVTSDFHTRRALSIFKSRLPNYRWSVAACRDDSVFQPDWWRRREWAKTAFMEWTKLIWWEAVDRWREYRSVAVVERGKNRRRKDFLRRPFLESLQTGLC